MGQAHQRDPSLLGMDLDFQRVHGKLHVGARKKEELCEQLVKDIEVRITVYA